MMRAALLLTMVVATPLMSQTVIETPREADIPKPVSVQISLAGADRPDVSRFLNVRRAVAPSLSPDGTRLAFRSSITGRPQLWVVDATGGWPEQLTFGESVTFHQWSPAGDWIVYGTDRAGNEREGFYLITPDGLEERELLLPTDAFRVFGGFSRDGRRIAYATTERNGLDFDIHVLDVASGEDHEVFRGRMGLYPVSWKPDGSALVLVETRGEDANDVYLLDLASGELDTLFQPDDPSSYSGFEWASDGAGFFVATNEGRDHVGLAYYELAGRTLIEMETPQRDVESVSLSYDDALLAWTTNEGGYSALHLGDIASEQRLEAPELPRGVYRVEWASRARVAAIFVSGPQVPGDIWVLDQDGGTMTRVTRSSTAGLDPGRFVMPEHHDFRARDGETLHGLLYLPSGPTLQTPPPLLLAVHGGPTAQARPDFDPVHQYLLTRGIAIFDLNFRGSTGYGKRFARLDNGRLRPNAVRDMADALDWLATVGTVDTSRAAVMGGSYGGYMALAALTDLPGRFRGGVSEVGVSNWVTALEGASPQLKASDRVEYGDIDDPDDREFFRRLSPITRVARVDDPVMIIHGANDPRDPVSESDQFVRAVRAREGEVEYLRFPDEGHGIRRLENRIIAYRRVAEFLERVLGVSGDER